LIRRSDNSLSL